MSYAEILKKYRVEKEKKGKNGNGKDDAKNDYKKDKTPE